MTDSKNALDTVAKHLPDAPIPPMIGIGAVSLQMALQYHDINTVQDGALYQQYKLEGKNFRDLQLDMVFDTATRIERHLMGTSDRIAGLVAETLIMGVESEESVKKMIDAFMEEDVPQHPEPWLLRENYLRIPGDHFPDTEQRKLSAFEKSLGLEDPDGIFYKGIMSEMSNEKKSVLLDKIDWCIRFDEIQTTIDNVVKQIRTEIPDVGTVSKGYDASMMVIDGTPSESLVIQVLVYNFKEAAGISQEEYPMFDKALSYFDADAFYDNLKTIYLK